MSRKKTLLIGTMILTLTGMISRVIGFFYRIFLSQTIGAEQLGIFQLVSPVYGMALAICSSGIQTSISRFVAARTEKKDKSGALHFVFTGTSFSLLLSLSCAFLLYTFAEPLGLILLGEPRTVPLLQVTAFSLPMSVIHSCIAGWYFGRNKTGIPSVSQLLEQTVRVFSSWILYLIFLQEGIAPSAMLAVLGTLAGDIVSCLFSLIVMKFENTGTGFHPASLKIQRNYLKLLLIMSFPLMANRVCMSFLHSLETVLLPARLQFSGMTASEALSTYGILTGMAMPLIFFPSSITNSVSVMLLPDVARNQASGNYRSIAVTISQTIRFCLILGVFCLGIFLVLGDTMGTILFHTDAAGSFLKVLAFLCPFLYLDSTLSSILTGLGKTQQVFGQNLLGHGIRIAFVWFAVPPLGIPGYLYGLLASEILTSFLRLFSLYRLVPFTFHAVRDLTVPSAAMLISLGGLLFLNWIPAVCYLPGSVRLILQCSTALFLYLILLRPVFPTRFLPGKHLSENDSSQNT